MSEGRAASRQRAPMSVNARFMAVAGRDHIRNEAVDWLERVEFAEDHRGSALDIFRRYATAPANRAKVCKWASSRLYGRAGYLDGFLRFKRVSSISSEHWSAISVSPPQSYPRPRSRPAIGASADR